MSIIATVTRQARVGSGDTITGVNTYTGILGMQVEDYLPPLLFSLTDYPISFLPDKVQMISLSADQDCAFFFNPNKRVDILAGDVWLWTVDRDAVFGGWTSSISVMAVTGGEFGTPSGLPTNIDIKVLVGA